MVGPPWAWSFHGPVALRPRPPRAPPRMLPTGLEGSEGAAPPGGAGRPGTVLRATHTVFLRFAGSWQTSLSLVTAWTELRTFWQAALARLPLAMHCCTAWRS